MSIVYTTDSDEHKISTGQKEVPQWCELSDEEIKQDIIDSWDTYNMIYDNQTK